jgi:hypothetical protein
MFFFKKPAPQQLSYKELIKLPSYQETKISLHSPSIHLPDSSSFYCAHKDNPEQLVGSILVKTVLLDNLIVDRIDFLKINIEAAEVAVLLNFKIFSLPGDGRVMKTGG